MIPRQGRPATKTKQLNVVIPASLDSAVRRAAVRDGVSLQRAVRHMLWAGSRK